MERGACDSATSISLLGLGLGLGWGKTQFAKALVPEGRSLDLNMASAPEPNLQEYDHEQHDWMLFDECSVQKVLLQKKLFQAPLSRVALGQSTTGCYAKLSSWRPMSGTVASKLLVVASMSSAGLMRIGWLLTRWCWM